jgi:soluble lytic murein transglycosylase
MRHALSTTLLAATLSGMTLLSPAPAAAQTSGEDPGWSAWDALVEGLPPADALLAEVPLRAQIAMLTGKLAEAAGYPTAAAQHYLNAAAIDTRMAAPLTAHAASLLLGAQTKGLPRLRALVGAGLLDAPIPGAALTQLGVHAAVGEGLPPAHLVGAALGEERRAACAALERALLPAPWIDGTHEGKKTLGALTTTHTEAEVVALLGVMHGRCEGPDYVSWASALGVEVDAVTRLQRANLLYSKVQFTATLAELDLIEEGALPEDRVCDALFRRARASYRLRKRRAESDAHFDRIVEECTSPGDELLRRRALYHRGKRAYGRKKLDASKAAYAALLAEYPEASHADDALMYLARIARDQGKRADQRALVERALSETPGGDMVHEIVWEFVEPTLRDGDYQTFLKELDGLTLPERDDQYFSQGRLEYFEGYAHAQLKQPDRAKKAWARAWAAYPFSFYGYLARERLVEAGVTEGIALARPAEADTGTFFTDAWGKTTAAALLAAGLPALAAMAEDAAQRAERTTEGQWRLATLHHLAGNYAVSHNIARRRIKGRPWADPVAGQVARWAVAWPNPFRALVDEAMAAERAQHDDHDVRAALALAIMREESSFVPDIESYAGALGLMQLMPRTARDHDRDIEGDATPDRLRTPEVNVRVAADHLFLLARRLDSHPVLMAAAYNAGAGACRRWLKKPRSREIGLWVEDIPYDQTRDYTKRVIGSYLAYQWLAGRDEIDAKVLSEASID